MSAFKKGDRVVVQEPEHMWDGRRGVVTREPGEEANPGMGMGPSSSYAVQFDGEAHVAAPFHDASMSPVGSLIVSEP